MRQPRAAPPPGAVHVYHADARTIAEPARSHEWLGWLSAAEHARFDRFRHDDDRLMFLCGRAMARELVGDALNVAPASWPWREGRQGRPEIALETPLRFNVAHSGGIVMCALSHGRDVGVDVEHLDRRPLDRGIVPRYCSRKETDDVFAADDAWQERFLRYWTLKEAYLKARGLGIAVCLADIEFTLGPIEPTIGFLGSLAGTDAGWRFDLFQPAARHLAAVATTTGDAPAFFPFI